MSSGEISINQNNPLGLEKSSENIVSEPHLIIHAHKGISYFELNNKNYWTFGRGKDNTLVIHDSSISRNHAILQRTENEEFYLIDLGSRNGTFVNGKRVIIPIPLRNGDLIVFGRTHSEFYLPSSSRKFSKNILEKKTVGIDQDIQAAGILDRRLMSIVVVNIHNVGALARQVEQQKLSQMMGHWLRQSALVIRDAGSWSDKYVEDAIMMIWFHDLANDSTISPKEFMSIFCCIQQIASLTKTLTKNYNLPYELKIGVGINTGYALVGNAGSEDNPDYIAIGDSVNTAFRLELAIKEIGLDMAIGESTYSYLKDFQSYGSTFKQQSYYLKGHDKPFFLYGTSFSEINNFVTSNKKFFY